ncbi:MAG: DUF3566 domain-containing protein [Actinomycetales bacterium]
MTAAKQPSPMAKALSKVSGAMKGPETADHASPAPAASAPASNGVPSAAVAAASAPPAPSAAPPGASPAYGVPPAAGAAGAVGAAGAGAGAASAATNARKTSAPPRPAAPVPSARRVRLTVARVDPWSVMKISFLVSVAIGIAFVVMVAVLWLILDGMGVFSSLNRTIADIQGTSNDFNLMDYIALPRVMSLSVVIGVIDVILLTALSTLGAFLYNVCSSLVGGVQLTLSDD